MPNDRPDDSFAALYEASAKDTPRRRRPRVGETLDATVVQLGKEVAFVDLGGGRQGFIELNELRGPDGQLQVAVGSTLRGRVAEIDAEQGARLVPTVEAAVAVGASVRIGEAGKQATAVQIAVGQSVSGTVCRVESYGVFLQIEGTTARSGRGLIPVAELGVARGADLRKAFALGTKLKAKVLELAADGKIRLSVRALKDDEERAQFSGYREAEKAAEAAQGFGTLGDLLKGRPAKK